MRPKDTMVGMMLGRIAGEDPRAAGAERLGRQHESRVAGQGRGRTTAEDQRRGEQPDDQRDFNIDLPQNETIAMTAMMAGKASTT